MKCEKCGRQIQFYYDELGQHPRHLSRFVFHFAEYDPWGEEN